MSLEYRIGDVFDRLREIPDGSIDLIVTSPPFLALRSYLPADHPDKHKEIGSEPTPAEFIDTLLALSAEWARVLAPHGSLCVELGDTHSGKSGWDSAGDDTWSAGADRMASESWRSRPTKPSSGPGWPLAKSLTGIPTLYPWSLAYGRNLLTGQPSPAGQWRIRNLIVWARPNPPVGALGDKFRPATSYITVACKGAKRYFDLDAVRTTLTPESAANEGYRRNSTKETDGPDVDIARRARNIDAVIINPAGAPPLDWHADNHPEDGDWLWKLSTQPYKGSHYATYPMKLPKRLIEAMCPQKVCTVCGTPSTRIVGDVEYVSLRGATQRAMSEGTRRGDGVNQWGADDGSNGSGWQRSAETTGWTDCPCPTLDDGYDPESDYHHDVGRKPWSKWRTGVVLDPFAGSGTTLEAAQAVGRHAIGIDLDNRNADLAQQRVGMFLTIDHGETAA